MHYEVSLIFTLIGMSGNIDVKEEDTRALSIRPSNYEQVVEERRDGSDESVSEETPV
jgi:hypothetical protein